MAVGAFSLAIGSFISSTMACWVMNDGYSTIYFDPAQEGWVWFFLQFAAIFIWQVSPVGSIQQNKSLDSFDRHSLLRLFMISEPLANCPNDDFLKVLVKMTFTTRSNTDSLTCR